MIKISVNRVLLFPTLFLLALPSLSCPAFWSAGHHVIAVMAYEGLDEANQKELMRILRHHPRFDIDFKVPESIRGDQEATQRWRVGVAGEWPDLIRGVTQYDRPTWHYQLGASVILNGAEAPTDPGPLPPEATMETQTLHIVQAIELCRRVLADSAQDDSDRAIALCWLAHLLADSHQPCHAGSLYSPIAFPNGDRGANGIPIKRNLGGQASVPANLHAFWDSLLGSEATPKLVEKKVAQLRAFPKPQPDQPGYELRNNRSESPQQWIRQSREAARSFVYSREILDQVQLAERELVKRIDDISLSDRYQRHAEFAGAICAITAARRLSGLWNDLLNQ